jgi:hypothetical protein
MQYFLEPMGISFLAISAGYGAVWLWFCFYLLSLLVPIIPAVIIYRLFPEGRTNGAQAAGSSIEGSVGGWKIKAVGAWGAYVTAFVLGVWTFKPAISAIEHVSGASVWTIESVGFQLTDEKGQPIENAALDESLRIVDGYWLGLFGKRADIKVISPTLGPPEKIQVKMDGYDFTPVDLTDVPADNGKIKLTTITLKQKPPIPVGSLPPEYPAGAGPPVVTSTH